MGNSVMEIKHKEELVLQSNPGAEDTATKRQFMAVDWGTQAEERKEYQRAKAERFRTMYGGNLRDYQRQAAEAFGPGGLHINYTELHKRMGLWSKIKGKEPLTRKERRLLAQIKRQRK